MNDLQTADIATRVHNTRPHQNKVYSPIINRSDREEEYDLSPVNNKKSSHKYDYNQIKEENEEQEMEVEQEQEEVVVEPSPVEKAEKIFSKLSKKLSLCVDREDQAKIVLTLLMKFRKQYALDDEVLDNAYKWGFLQLLFSNSEKMYRFVFLVEEAFNCILPIMRSPKLKEKVVPKLIKCGALVFCMTAIRMFHKSNGNIRVHAVEVLSTILDFVDKCKDNSKELNNKMKKLVSINYVIHHLLLHGAASSFPSLLNFFIQSSADISVQRLLKCLTFVLRETPADMSVTVAMNNRWSMLRDLLFCVRSMNAEAKVQGAVLIIGLIASSAVIGEKIIEMQAWDDLSTVLVNPELDFSVMPEAWLEKSLDTMKLLNSRNAFNKVNIPQKSLCEKFTYINFDAESQTTDSLDFWSNHELDASTFSGDLSERDHKLSLLPSAFWPKPSPHVMRDEIDRTKEPDMKTRLTSSPFGNPSAIFAKNDKIREENRKIQKELRKGNSRLLKNPRPNKVLRVSQRKKLYPSHPEYQRQQTLRERKNRPKSSGPVEVPEDTVLQKVVAQKLFSDQTSSSRPSSGKSSPGGRGKNVNSPTKNDTPTSMDHLSYAERLQVMILHCQDAYNKNNEC